MAVVPAAGAPRMFLQLAFLCFLAISAADAGFHPLSAKDKAFAQQLFSSHHDLASLEQKYQALRSLQVLGIKSKEVVTCTGVTDVLASSKSELKDIFYAARISEILQCPLVEDDLKLTASNLLSSLSSSNTLLDLHFSIVTLSIIKNQIKEDLTLENAVEILKNVRDLSEADGTWKYSANDAESSAMAAGIAMETLASLIRIAGPKIEKSALDLLKATLSKLFESVKSYDDGTLYFEGRKVDSFSGTGGSIAATSCVVRGVTAYAAVSPGKLNVNVLAEKVLGIANFFLSVGIPSANSDAFHVLDALGLLEENRLYVPLVLSVSSSVLSLTSKDILEVSVTTVLGSPIPTKVTLLKAARLESKKTPVLTNKVLESDADNISHRLALLENQIDLGKYELAFEVKSHNEEKDVLVVPHTTQIMVTGVATISNIEVGVLDSDTGSTEISKKWNPSTKELVSLFANHLQKLYISLDVYSPLNKQFTPHQVFLKLTHESQSQHLFLVKPSKKHLELELDLLGLVEKLNYLSGVYTIELIVGDDLLENSFMWTLGTVELDLPEPPEGVAKTSAVVDSKAQYGPKPEISHIFRPAEKRAPATLSNAFLGLTAIPLLGFLIGLKLLNTNLKSFPTSGLPMFAALAFHAGIASILGLYFLFWLKFNLFETLKLLSILGVFLVVPGHYLLSHLADSSPKMKTA